MVHSRLGPFSFSNNPFLPVPFFCQLPVFRFRFRFSFNEGRFPSRFPLNYTTKKSTSLLTDFGNLLLLLPSSHKLRLMLQNNWASKLSSEVSSRRLDKITPEILNTLSALAVATQSAQNLTRNHCEPLELVLAVRSLDCMQSAATRLRIAEVQSGIVTVWILGVLTFPVFF